MKKFFSMLVAAAVVGTMALAAQAVPPVPGDLIIDHMENPNEKQRYEVPFSHQKHASLGTDVAGCQKCHHKWDGKAEIKSCAADGCHPDVTSFRSTEKDPKFLITAFHLNTSTYSCSGCHRQMKQAGEQTGPTACAPCHNPQ